MTKMYQMDIRYTKWLINIPNGHAIYQYFTFQGPPKLTQIGSFGLKRNHLTTLVTRCENDDTNSLPWMCYLL
jgi:hypothetical protein